MDENDFLILLQAKLDEAKSKENINANIDGIQKQLDKLKIQAEIDPKTAQKLADDIGKLINQKIVISNIGIDAKAGIKAGQEYGKQISQGLAQEMKSNTSVLESFKQSLKNIGMDSKEIDAVANRINNLGVQIETLNQTISVGKKDVLSVNIAGIDQYGQAVKLTQQYDAATGELINTINNVSTVQQKAGSATNVFIEKQKKAVASAYNTLSAIESKLNDPNISKSLASTDFNVNGLNEQLERARSAISVLDNASRETFTQAQIDVDKEITELTNLISTLKNAEYAATSLRTKDISTIKIDEGNKLESFVQKMEQSGHYTDDLRNKVVSLKTDLSNVFDASSLTSYLNGVSNLQSEFQKVDAIAKTSEKSTKLKTNIEAEKKTLQVYTAELKEASALTGDVKEKIQEMFRSLSKVDTQNALSTWRAELKGVKTEIDAVVKSTMQKKSKEEKLANTMASVREKTEQARQAEEQRQQTAQNKAINKAIEDEYLQRQKLADQVKGIQFSMDNGYGVSEYQNRIQSLINDFQKYGVAAETAKSQTSSLQQILNNMNGLSGQELVTQADKLEQEFKAVKVSVEQAKIAYDKYMQPVSNEKAASLINRINNFLSRNTRITKEARHELEGYVQELEKGVHLNKWNEISTKLKETENSMRGLHRLGASFKDQMSQAAQNFTQWLSISSAVMLGVSKTKDAIRELKELDSILTEISKTSDLTSMQLKELGENAFDSASKYGRTAADYLTGVQEMYRAGFDNAEEMARLSLLAQAAGDMASNSANDYLMATNAAYNFKGSVKELNSVLDSQNHITNNAAVSMQDMADATSEAASIAAQYGVKIDELSALIAVATSKTRESGSEVGNALKSIFVTLQDTTSKPVAEAFDAVGISMTKIVEGAERLKTPIELLKELSDAFNKLPEGDTKRANILTDIGKKYHANTLSAILSDWESYESMLDLYSQGMGSAAKEAEKSANNIEGSLNRLSNTWTDTVGNIADSDAIITIINSLNSLLSVGNKLTKWLGSFGTIGAASGLFMNLKGIGERTICSSGKLYRAHPSKVT